MSVQRARRKAVELLQVVPKLVDGLLLGQPNIVAKAANISGDVTRQHEQVFARLGGLRQGVDPLF